MENRYAVIMAGGAGERFWPLSTSKNPKQMLSLFGGKPLIRMALERLEGLIPLDHIFVITGASHVEGICRNIPELREENVIGEPFGRDTAAAIALGLACISAKDQNAIFCVVTADHIIGDIDIFQKTLSDSMEFAYAKDCLITIGITPKYPSTGFGYIEAGDLLKKRGNTKFYKGKRFVEKPNIKIAKDYINEGNYFWNSGMFVWSAKSIQKALMRHAPHLIGMARRAEKAFGTSGFNDCLYKEYSQLEKISIDYAVMERADNIIMTEGNFEWDDVGSWTAVSNYFNADGFGNVVIGLCEAEKSNDNIVVSEGRMTALLGVRDMVVVQSEKATLICKKEDVQEVKRLVSRLRENGYGELI